MARKHTPAAQAPKAPAAPANDPVTPASTDPALATVVTALANSAVQAPTTATVRQQALATLAASANPPAWLATPIAATLPPSLIAKGAGLLAAPKGIPAAIAATKYVTNGLLYQRAKAHNLAWATTCAQVCAANPGGATVAQWVAAGVGMHSVQAYLKRGWFVPAPAAQDPATPASTQS